MQNYKDLSNNSGVLGFEIGNDFIIVEFKTGAMYEYTNESAGVNNIEEMQRLAQKGMGLNGFINSNVKYKYSRKMK